MRLLMINPNTTVSITDKVVEVARQCAAPGTEIVGATGRFGARYISSRTASAIAGHAALDAWANAGPHDGVILACFGDPGLDALRELSPKPVVGMADASIHAACMLGQRFAIVTGGERWVAMLEEFVAARGLAGRLAGVLAVPQTGAAIAQDPDAALDALAACCRTAVSERGADCVILGGAGTSQACRRASPIACRCRWSIAWSPRSARRRRWRHSRSPSRRSAATPCLRRCRRWDCRRRSRRGWGRPFLRREGARPFASLNSSPVREGSDRNSVLAALGNLSREGLARARMPQYVFGDHCEGAFP